MIILTGTTEKIRVSTSGDSDVYVTWMNRGAGGMVFDKYAASISNVINSDIVSSPSVGESRIVKSITFRNTHVTASQDVSVIYTDGVSTTVELAKFLLSAQDTLQYEERTGFVVLDRQGRVKASSIDNSVSAAVNATNLVVLPADVVNASATANTLASITGLSFPVIMNGTYFFRFTIMYTCPVTTTGSRWTVSGPGTPIFLRYRSEYPLTLTAQTINEGLTLYDTPAACNATTSSLTSNIAIIQGFIFSSAPGTVIARFASEVASSAITAKQGSFLEWYRVS